MIYARMITDDYFLRGKNTNNQEQIWFAGGATRDTANDAIWRFTPKDNKMSRMGRMLQPRYRVSLLFSSRQLDRNAAGRGRHQLMVDGGNHPGKLKSLLEPPQNLVQLDPVVLVQFIWSISGPYD